MQSLDFVLALQSTHDDIEGAARLVISAHNDVNPLGEQGINNGDLDGKVFYEQTNDQLSY